MNQRKHQIKEPKRQILVDTLASEILEGTWNKSQTLTLENLQHRFDVSRTVARDAARYLQSLGVIAVGRRVGLVAREPSMWQALSPQVITWKLHSRLRSDQLLSFIELRLAVEPAAAEDAARQAPLEVKAKMPVLAREIRRLSQESSWERFHELDIEFHSLLMENSGNEMFAALSPLVSTVLRGRVELNLYPSHANAQAMQSHQQVADAVWKSDPQRARTAMQDIVDEVRTELFEQLEK